MRPYELDWWSTSVEALSADAFDELASVCSGVEMQRAERFVFARDRRSYLAAHGLLRLALSAADPARLPGEWHFANGPHGRPELSEQIHSALRFNLSHCATRVTCVVCLELDCGVDVESVSRSQASPAIDAYCLAQSEQTRIDRLAGAEREVEFTRLWTLKEALAKAVGMGLHLPFAELEFGLDPHPLVLAVPAQATGPWWLAQHFTGDGHVESLALRIDSEWPIEVARIEWAGSHSTVMTAGRHALR